MYDEKSVVRNKNRSKRNISSAKIGISNERGFAHPRMQCLISQAIN